MSLKKDAVWISGASSGIGKALAAEFVRNGSAVIGTARRISLLEDLAGELNNSKGSFLPLHLDNTDSGAVSEFYSRISANYNVTCLINNAGTTSFKSAENDSVEEIERIIMTNLLGSVYAIKCVLPQMIEMKGGTIINVLSVVTHKIFYASSAYSASKAGLDAYTKVLREELRDKNIRVINIHPGATATPIWPASSLDKYSDRMMTPDNIARLIYTLFSVEGNIVPEEIVIRPIKGDL